MKDMTPAEHGRYLASLAPPLTDEQVEAAARILAGAGYAIYPCSALPRHTGGPRSRYWTPRTWRGCAPR